MTQEQIIQRAITTAKRLRSAASSGYHFGYPRMARRMREGANAIEALVGLLQQKKTAPGGDAPRAAE